MDHLPQSYHDIMHAFCHLRPERSFIYPDGLQSILCHRCSAIYGGFLLAFIAARALRWNGRWSAGGQPWQELMWAAGLVGLSVLQVGAEDLLGSFFFTSNTARFLVGCLTGFGLLQFNRLLQDAPAAGLSRRPAPLVLALPVLFIPHYLLSEHSWWYATVTTAAGVMAIYAVMNFSVLRSFFPAAGLARLAPCAALLVAAEWLGIYLYNR